MLYHDISKILKTDSFPADWRLSEMSSTEDTQQSRAGIWRELEEEKNELIKINKL